MKQCAYTIISTATAVATTLLISITPTFGNTNTGNTSFGNSRPQQNRRQERPWGTASRSWCLGVKGQWEFRKRHFGQDNQMARAMFEEGNCGYWGITLPGSGSYQENPNSSRPVEFPGFSIYR